MPERMRSNRLTECFFLKHGFFWNTPNNQARLATAFPVKDSSVFSLFMNTVHLKLDTLAATGFSPEYIFLALNVNSKGTKDRALKYDPHTPYLEYVGIPAFCQRYVLCVNTRKGTSYRIQGFTGNDFLGLLKEVQTARSIENARKLKISQLLKPYAVPGIDFKCLYEGLASGEYDTKKYPCLGNCEKNEVIWIN